MPLRTFLGVVALPGALSLSLAGGAAAAANWDFRVTLDGKPIGEHRFIVTDDGEKRHVESEARYAVRLLGVPVYRYEHHDEETWRGDCLGALAARTDDNGSRTEVGGRTEGGEFVWQVTREGGVRAQSRTSCPMTFAYWSPALAGRTELLDPGSGHLDSVKIHTLPGATIEVHGVATAVRGLRIEGLEHPIDVWYLGDQWVGLDTMAGAGRALRYRLP